VGLKKLPVSFQSWFGPIDETGIKKSIPAMPWVLLLLGPALAGGNFVPGGSSLAKSYYIPSPYSYSLY
jgi:hypothetical protein